MTKQEAIEEGKRMFGGLQRLLAIVDEQEAAAGKEPFKLEVER